jgi:hypothetical protein
VSHHPLLAGSGSGSSAARATSRCGGSTTAARPRRRQADLLDGCWDWEDAWHVVRRLEVLEMAVAPVRRREGVAMTMGGVDSVAARGRLAGTKTGNKIDEVRPFHSPSG